MTKNGVKTIYRVIKSGKEDTEETVLLSLGLLCFYGSAQAEAVLRKMLCVLVFLTSSCP